MPHTLHFDLAYNNERSLIITTFVWYLPDELSINLTLRGDPVDTAMSSTKEYNTAEEGIIFESGLIEFDTL